MANFNIGRTYYRGLSLGRIVDKIVTPICRKQGLVTADLMLNWQKIIGEQYAKFCKVSKITFPRINSTGINRPGKSWEGVKNPGTNRQNGCLEIFTSSAMATTIMYSKETIIDRVNQHYGYKLIGQLRINHYPLNVDLNRKNTTNKQTNYSQVNLTPEWQQLLATVTDQPLRQALENLAKCISPP